MKIWITGTRRGLGAALQEGFTEKGASVLGLNRPHWELSEINLVPRWMRILLESTTDSDLPDVFVHNSGTMQCDWVEDVLPDQFEYVMNVNCTARFAINKELIRRYSDLLQPRKLRIIHICSVASNFPLRTSTAYCASKAADAMMVRQMAKELTGRYDNIRIFGVNPNGIQGTGMIAQAVKDLQRLRGMTEEEAIKYNTQSPMGRLCTPREVFEIVYWLATSAPEYMTGELVTMPGGMPV